ncbi:MAG TPA: hypothetical protein VE978_03900 [Chitinophagales bacterium]|nr:hypothetical protein [Chitinophagales bacterium]
MDFNAVIDASAFIWDEEKFLQDQTPYYNLANQLMTFVEIFETKKPQIFLRSNLLAEMLNVFPWNLTADKPYFYEFKNVVYSFLARLPEQIKEFDASDRGVSSKPNIIYSYYNYGVKQEITFLISEIHFNTTITVYFTFKPIWEESISLNTLFNGIPKEHETIILPIEDNLEGFFNRFKLIFKHNPKHDRNKGFRIENGEEVSPLSCFDGKNDKVPQLLLDKAIKSKEGNGKLYSYDKVNQTYICFVSSGSNEYHGYDEKLGNIPASIKKYFGKH